MGPGLAAMTSGRRYFIAAIVFLVVFITWLHYETFIHVRALHDIYRELYYLPALLGALVFGLRGALLTYLFSSALYFFYVFTHWTRDYLYETDRFLHFLFTGLFASLVGFLVDRDRRNREQMEKERYLAGLGQAASMIVHDLKTPLAVISGFAKRIREGKTDPDAAQIILDATDDMRKIVHDVLDFAKPIRLELKEEDLGHVVARACNLSRVRAEKRRITLPVSLPGVPLKVMLDGFQMERALVNLVNNAVEASKEGQEVAVGIVTGKESLSVRIEDHGSGMDSETLTHIFLPFYTKKAAGTGLGMPIAKKIIEGHHGKIHIRSTVGKGTVIRIELPYTAGHAPR
ncbi:MAG TPA: HAMP domain-containing sensor histidine kinase [Dissulfurispiraceae bacterium]